MKYIGSTLWLQQVYKNFQNINTGYKFYLFKMSATVLEVKPCNHFCVKNLPEGPADDGHFAKHLTVMLIADVEPGEVPS